MNHESVDSALRLVDREIWIVTAAVNQERRGGLVATWVMQGSLDPESPLLVAALAPNHYTTELVEASGAAFAAHLIPREQIDLAWRFALGSGRTIDKLSGINVRTVVSGAPVLADCLAWFDCRVVARFHAGDRTFFWGAVLDGGQQGSGQPLRESGLLAAASPEQKAALRANRESDIELQRPMRRFP